MLRLQSSFHRPSASGRFAYSQTSCTLCSAFHRCLSVCSLPSDSSPPTPPPTGLHPFACRINHCLFFSAFTIFPVVLIFCVHSCCFIILSTARLCEYFGVLFVSHCPLLFAWLCFFPTVFCLRLFYSLTVLFSILQIS